MLKEYKVRHPLDKLAPGEHDPMIIESVREGLSRIQTNEFRHATTLLRQGLKVSDPTLRADVTILLIGASARVDLGEEESFTAWQAWKDLMETHVAFESDPEGWLNGISILADAGCRLLCRLLSYLDEGDERLKELAQQIYDDVKSSYVTAFHVEVDEQWQTKIRHTRDCLSDVLTNTGCVVSCAKR